jgi:DNA repair protein RadD
VFLKEDVEKELKHEADADLESDTTKPHSVERWYTPSHIVYSRHLGRDGKPDTLKVTYICGKTNFYEFKGFDHPRDSWANKFALKWAQERGSVPRDIENALAICDTWKKPKTICVRPQKGNPKYNDVCGYEW